MKSVNLLSKSFSYIIEMNTKATEMKEGQSEGRVDRNVTVKSSKSKLTVILVQTRGVIRKTLKLI